MHKDHRKGVDTRVALLAGLRRQEFERADVLAATPVIDSPPDVQPTSVAPLGTSQPLPPAPAKHRYRVPGALRRLAAHVRTYFIGQLRHDLYVRVERSTATVIDRLVAENQETRGDLRRLSARLDELARQSARTDANRSARRRDRDLSQPGEAQRAPNSQTTRARELTTAAAIEDVRDEIAQAMESLRLGVKRAVDTLEVSGAGEALSGETRAQIAALPDLVERLTTHHSEVLLQLERAFGDTRRESEGASRQ